MLTRLHRHGPSRYRLVKGYTVLAQDAQAVNRKVQQSELSLPSVGAHPPRVRMSTRDSTFVIDLGMLWLHKADLRSKTFQELQAVVAAIAALFEQHGGRLLPAAVRPPESSQWKPWLCADFHLLEVVDSLEREVFCNLVRTYVPQLIALTGRAGISTKGVEALGSRRLYDSTEHYATRYLASVSPRHLPRVIQCLRREGGIDRLDLMDINPLGDANDKTPNVELRFVDAQAFLASVRAQVILFQALLIRARRLVRQGRRVGATPQALLERNRANAIAHGLHARFEQEEAGDRNRRQERLHGTRVSGAAAATLELIEDLEEEFQVLDAKYDELRPLVLGVSLASMGYPAVQNESDLLNVNYRKIRDSKGGYVDTIAAAIRYERLDQAPWIAQVNEDAFPDPARWIRYRWESTLRLGYQEIRDNQKASTPSATVPTPATSQRATSLQQGAEQSEQRDVNMIAAKQLLALAEGLRQDATLSDRLRILQRFFTNTDAAEIHTALSVLKKEEASDLRRRLRPPRDLRHRLFLERGKDEPRLEPILLRARRHGVCSIEFETTLKDESVAIGVVERLTAELPSDLRLLLTQRAVFSTEQGKHLLLELLLIRRPTAGESGTVP